MTAGTWTTAVASPSCQGCWITESPQAPGSSSLALAKKGIVPASGARAAWMARTSSRPLWEMFLRSKAKVTGLASRASTRA